MAEDPDPETRSQMQAMIDAGDDAPLAACFAGALSFGTAGLRGPMGPGPARFNRATVRRISAGLGAYLRDGSAGVVVAHDARRGSAAFAEEAASVLAGAGLRVAALPGPLPTPVLAFAVRHLRATAGVMITASHNPAGDNGYKVYWTDGAQIVAPVDREIAASIDAVGDLRSVVAKEVAPTAAASVVGAYLDAVVPASLHGEWRDVSVAYTPLHGVGRDVLLAAFERGGFAPPAVVAAQGEPDGTFPTVERPNPEEPGTMDLLLAEAERLGVDLALANDPDADRLCVAVPESGAGGGTLGGRRWRVLTGDEIGAVLAEHVLATAGRDDPPPRYLRPAGERDLRPAGERDRSWLVVTTVVSSGLLRRMAAAAGIRYAETLTGFKWIMRAGRHDEVHGGVAGGAPTGDAADARFLFGYEEALGYAVTDLVRDKDGISAALAMAEAAARAKAQGRDLGAVLDDLACRFGLHATASRSVALGGGPGDPDVSQIMSRLRSSPPESVAGRLVSAVDDFDAGVRRRRGGSGEALGLPRADVVAWHCDDGTRVVVRPSGTEPKLKVYLQVVVPVDEREALGSLRAEAAQRLEELASQVMEMIGT